MSRVTHIRLVGYCAPDRVAEVHPPSAQVMDPWGVGAGGAQTLLPSKPGRSLFQAAEV